MDTFTLKLVIEHRWDVSEIQGIINNSYYYKEFNNVGFIILCDYGDVILLVAASIDDKHSMDMWRVIRSTLKERTKPVITQYERNTDELFKASARYGVQRLENDIAYFGV